MTIQKITLITLFILGFLIGSALIMGGLRLSRHDQPSFGIVDAQALVSVEAQKVAKQYPKGVVPSEKLQAIAAGLKKRVDRFANEHKMIVLAKGAVWGGELPDYTEHFLEALTNQENRDVP